MANNDSGQGHYKFPPITEAVYVLPDGRTTTDRSQATDGFKRLHRFRTSSLKTLDICAERTRLEMSGTMPKTNTSSTAMGHAVHAAAEVTLAEVIDCGVPLGVDDAIDVAQAQFSELIAEPEFKWVDIKEGGARVFIELSVRALYAEVLSTVMDVVDVERAFGPLVLHEDDERVIELVGTTDAVFGNCLKDWKTSTGKKWEAWEHERWDIQPTSYLWAAQQLGWMAPDEDGLFWFEFVIFERTRVSKVDVRRIWVSRHQGDFDWLERRAVNTAKLIEAELPSWPLNDNSALCGPKFCPAWNTCKGAHYQEGWPKPSRPAA